MERRRDPTRASTPGRWGCRSATSRGTPVRAPARGADDDLFVWDDCGRRGASSPGGRPTPGRARRASEFNAPAGGAGGGRDADAARAARDDLDRRYEREARASGDWRAPEYPTTGSGRGRYEPADGYETSEEWEEWLEPEAPHGAETIGPLPERHKGPRRRRASAGAVLVAMLLGFFFAGLLEVRRGDPEAHTG